MKTNSIMKAIKHSLLTIAMLLCSLTASAHDFEVDGIYYDIISISDLTVSVTYKGSEYSSYREYSGEVVIPEKVKCNGKEYSVKKIGYQAFSDCIGLTSVIIPNSVTEISTYAFQNCSGITNLTIPNSVTSINDRAFIGCSGKLTVNCDISSGNNNGGAFQGGDFTSVIIGESVTSIGSYAFRYCSDITSLTIPNSVTNIEVDAFTGTGWYNNQPDGVLYLDDWLIDYKGDMPTNTSIEIKDGTKHIANSAFLGCFGLTSVAIPNSVTSIGQSAFNGCSGLTSVTIPNSVTSIGDWTFRGCSGLTSVTIPNSVTSIGYGAFYDCSGLTSVTIPNSVTSIGESAFEGCSSLTSVTIPNSVTSIRRYAFEGCSSLTSVTIGNSVTSIGYGAFDDCSGLKNLYIADGDTELSLGYNLNSNSGGQGLFYDCALDTLYLGRNLKYDIGISYGHSPFANNKSLTSVTIGNSVTSIGSSAFEGCSSLTSVTIGNSVTSIGGSAFCYCYCLTNVTIPNSVTSINANAFAGCSGLTSVTIGNSVTSIGNYAFSGCSSLKNLRIEDGDTELSLGYDLSDYSNGGQGLFFDCALDTLYLGRNLKYDTSSSKGYSPFAYNKSLKSVTIGNSVTSIGSYAFEGCSGLTSVTIPNSVTSIGSSAFSGCSGLTSVTIPNSVTSIGGSAFSGCFGLTSFTIPNSVTSIGNYAFEGCSSLKNLRIEDGDTELSLGYDLSDYSNGGQGLFFDCALDTLYLGRNLQYNTSSTYGYSPFANNKSLTSVTIGNSVTSIGSYAFNGCSGLTSVHTGDLSVWCKIDFANTSSNPTYYAKKLYLNGEEVKNLVIPTSVSTIGRYSFYNCDGIISVTIPNSVTSIGSSAFSGCSGLTSVHTNDIAAWCKINFANTSANPTYYAKKIYLDNSMIKNLVLSENVSSVANYAFYNCSSITGVEISNSVKTIGNQVFEGCNALRKVIIKDGNSALSLGNNYNSSSGGKGLFYDCPLDSVYIGRNTDYSSGLYYGFSPFANKRTLSSVAIGNNVTRISSYAFQGCTALKSITIPSSVTSIYSGAFTDCSGLTSVHTNNLTAWCKISFGDEFSNPTYYAHTLYLNDEEIRDLVIPSGIWQVKSHAFTYCSRLLTLSIPSSVTSIGTGAFNNCYGINKVSIPYSVRSIGADAFNNCYSLSDIECYASEPPSVDETTFSAYTYSNAALFVPASSKEKYNAAQIWRDFTRINNLTDIEALKLSKDVAVMTVGKSLTLIANVVCDNPASKTVTWTSSNESVATVSNGVVTALKAGKSTITAICEDVKATCEVTVNEKSDLSFIVPDITVCPTESFSLPIELENTLEVSAFQCDVYLPEGITLQKNSKGKYDVTLNVDRCDDHTISAVEQEDGSIRLVAFSMTSSSISDTEGALFNLNLIAGEEIGTYTVEVKNINVSDANGNLTYLSDAAGTIEVYYKPGDANGDGSVLVNDVVYTVNKILGIEADDFIFRAADMNSDGNILVNDVVLIVNTILGVKPSTAALAPRHMNAFETLSMADSRTAYGMTEFGITLSNAGRYTAMQFDMELADGADIADIKVSMPTDHSVAYRRIDDTTVRVVVTSLTNEALAEGAQLSISMKDAAGKTVAFTNGRAACNNGQMVGIMPGSTVLGGTTGIDGVNAEFAPADVYSIDGKVVKKNATTLDGLKPGVYVVNGRKVVVER